MTDAPSVEHAECQTPRLTLEAMHHGAVTVHYDDIQEAIRLSIKDNDWTVATAMQEIRARRLVVYAIWKNRKRHGILLVKPVADVFTGTNCLLLYGLHGSGMQIEEWQEASSMFEDIAKKRGYTRLIAMTKNERLITIAKLADWQCGTYCWKEIN